MIDLSTLTFDYMKFISMPRCMNQFYSKERGAGCSLTAFWHALGFEVHRVSSVNETQNTDLVKYMIKNYHTIFTHPEFGMLTVQDMLDATNKLSGADADGPKFTGTIVHLHDSNREDQAIALILNLVRTKFKSELPVEAKELCAV